MAMTTFGKHNPVLVALLAASFATCASAGPEDTFIGPMPIRPEPASVAPTQPRTNAPTAAPGSAPAAEFREPAAQPAPERAEPVKPLDLAPLAESVKASRPNPDAQIALGGKSKAESQPATPSSEAPATTGLGVTRTILSLSVVIALILLIAGVVKKLSGRVGGLTAALGAAGKAPSGILSILGRYPLDRSTTLILLRVDRRVLLLCQTRASGRFGSGTACVVTLSEFASEADVASIVAKATAADGKAPSQRFQQALEDEGVLPEEPAPARPAPAAKPAKKQTEQEALAAMLRAALEASKAERPAAAPATPKPSKIGGSDAAAELRTRLAAMRAKAALGGNPRRTEMVA
jgi:flagellar biogenesis protein FliO